MQGNRKEVADSNSHQWSLVIGSLAPRENVFCEMDVTLYVPVPAMLSQHSTSIFPEMLFGLEVGDGTDFHAGNIPEHFRDR